jgi:hypothetical protein
MRTAHLREDAMIDRRSFAAVALLAPVLGGARAFAAPRGEVQEFAVFRNDRPIGRHSLRFSRDGDRLAVEIDIELEVRLAFITLYRYRHSNRELWEGGRFLSFASRTDDNGTRHEVKARRAGEAILVEGSHGLVEAPGDALPTTYWHRRFLDAPVWIDTQEGALKRCRVTPTGTTQVAAAGTSVGAERYAISGDLTLDLWYAGAQWVKLEFKGSDGSTIDYRLKQAVPDLVALAG